MVSLHLDTIQGSLNRLNNPKSKNLTLASIKRIFVLLPPSHLAILEKELENAIWIVPQFIQWFSTSYKLSQFDPTS